MIEKLRKNLIEKRKESMAKFNSARENFEKKEKEIRADLAEASRFWNKMNKTLEAKKRGDRDD